MESEQQVRLPDDAVRVDADLVPELRVEPVAVDQGFLVDPYEAPSKISPVKPSP